MQRSLIIGLCLIMCAALLGAGCISNPGTGNVSATGTAATVSPANISLAPLALGPADIPAGSALTSARQKSADEVSTLAKDLGWQQGYVIIYSTPANSTGGPALITQTLTVYSKKSMADIVALVDSSERQQKGLVFSRLALPATGADTIAFSAAPVTVTPTLTTGGMTVPAQGADASTQAEGYSEVIFGKGTVLEVIRMSGPGAQYDTLKSLAETAYAKLG